MSVYSVSDLDKEFKKLWPKSKDIFIKKEENDCYLIKFQTQNEYEVVLKFRPWFLEGDLLALEPWNPQIPRSSVDLTKHLMWMRLYNMQPGFANPKIVYSIAEAMGKVKELDPPDCVVPKGKVQKALVLLDVRNPLRREFWVENVVGEKVWIRLFYEKQPFNLCGFCYTIDHKELECEIIVAYLLQQQRGYLSSTSILDPPSWTNPDSRVKSANQHAIIEQGNQNENEVNQPETSQNDEGRFMLPASTCMHAKNTKLSLLQFNVEVNKDSVSLNEQHKDNIIKNIPLDSTSLIIVVGCNSQGFVQVQIKNNIEHEKQSKR
ncbi:uncharacterized protein LOC113359484 [Papaver somniferum]|uniref:uncharacterized protein LOC113359484 n=1 Tax=Papaver somniferum TaxID=3469 RepID=UPI000E700FFC|nr:uncharacterized protein LOC113359484 [Papaver somniferum]